MPNQMRRHNCFKRLARVPNVDLIVNRTVVLLLFALFAAIPPLTPFFLLLSQCPPASLTTSFRLNQKHIVLHYRPSSRFRSVIYKYLDSVYSRNFQFRLCNPPPAVSKVRSCGGELVLFIYLSFPPASHLSKVTPLLSVRLLDVLDRKHLPPLGESLNLRIV